LALTEQRSDSAVPGSVAVPPKANTLETPELAAGVAGGGPPAHEQHADDRGISFTGPRDTEPLAVGIGNGAGGTGADMPPQCWTAATPVA